MGSPQSYKFIIKPYDANFTVSHEQFTTASSQYDPQCYEHIFLKYAENEIKYYENMRDGTDNIRKIISIDINYLHIGNIIPDGFEMTLEYIQRHGSIKYKSKYYHCGHGLLTGCDGSNNLSASNVRCWCNKLYIECNTVSLITSEIVDNIPNLCLLALMVLGNNGSIILRLGIGHSTRDFGFIIFLCSKFHECEMFTVRSAVYLYCRFYKRDNSILRLIKNLLCHNYICDKLMATDTIMEIYKQLLTVSQ